MYDPARDIELGRTLECFFLFLQTTICNKISVYTLLLSLSPHCGYSTGTMFGWDSFAGFLWDCAEY